VHMKVLCTYKHNLWLARRCHITGDNKTIFQSMSKEIHTLKDKDTETPTLGTILTQQPGHISLLNLFKQMEPIFGSNFTGEKMLGPQTKQQLSGVVPTLVGGTNQTHNTQTMSVQNTFAQCFILPLSNQKKKYLQEEFTTSQLSKEATHLQNKLLSSPN